ncbi:MAG: methionyl-tRNA formyltransferase [Chromatiales bacterium]|nr:methionyl-tRNA formyltransferase [Chromatiales bacterium]
MRLIFAGTPEFSSASLHALIDSGQQLVGVYTQPDRPSGRGRKLTVSPVKALAEKHGLPVFQPKSLKNASAQAELADLQPDLMIVAAYGLILPQAVLDIPRLGCVNVHASLLPRWRGAAPIQRAIMAGDSETGITLMQMEAGLDTGPMLIKRPCPIATGQTGGELHDALAELGAKTLAEALPDLFAHRLTPVRQDDSLATYAHKLEKAEAQIDWSDPALAIERKILAFNPWPVAQTRLGAETLRLWRAHALPGDGPRNAPPGSVIATNAEGVDVATGEGVLRLTELQRPGKKPVSARDFVNAVSLHHARLGT